MRYKQEEFNRRKKLDLNTKILMTKQRISDWYYYWGGNVYISFSGGKDSTVLLDIVRREFPNVLAIYVDTRFRIPRA